MVEVAALLLCAALIAGCAGTPSTNATTAPTSSAHTASPTAGTPAATISSAPNGTVATAVNGSITGTKFNDLNGNGRRDPRSGPGLSGWTIILELQEPNGSAWSEVKRTTTGGMGAYGFSNLSPGHYRVSEVMRQGWTQTFPAENNGTTELDISIGRPFWDGIDFGNFAGPNATGTVGATGTATATGTASATATGTAGTTSTTAAVTTAGPVTVSLTAQNIKFDKGSISVPAGATVTVNFNNMDSGVPHNFAVYTDSSASTNIFRGQIVTGPTTTTYTFTAPSTPGTYYFRCDVHPTQMTGQFIVT